MDDVIIIVGSFAGLAAALQLGRAHRPRKYSCKDFWREILALVSHDAMLAHASLAGLVAKFTLPEIVEQAVFA